MEKTLFALSLGFVGLILATQAGWAAPRCGPRDEVVSALAETYSETRHAIGLADGAEQVIELFANTETGSWTITMTQAQGVTCLVAAGDQFETLAEPLPAKGDTT